MPVIDKTLVSKPTQCSQSVCSSCAQSSYIQYAVVPCGQTFCRAGRLSFAV